MAEWSDNINEVTAQLRQLRDKYPAILKDTMKIVGVQMLSWAKQDFEKRAKGDEAGGISWEPIGREGARSRLRKLGSYKKLDKASKTALIDQTVAQHTIGVDTGRLRNSLGVGSAESINEATESYVVVGTKNSIAEYYDEKRPIFGDGFISSGRVNQIEEIVEKKVEDYLKRTEPFDGS